MSDKEPTQDKAATTARGGKKEIELFPVQERRPMASAQPVPAGGGMRLGTQISIFNPVTFDDALEIVECLRGRAATTIALDAMKKGDANRLIDFVSGASAALDGDFHKLTEQVYVFCPSNIRIVAPVKPSGTKSGTAPGALDFLFSAEIIGGDKSGAPRKS
jgi:FtsZ-interacting cell division protein YlmF